MVYQAVFEPNEGGGYGVYFPDLPGCTSYGETLERAQVNAREALRLHIHGMEKDGEEIPAPSGTIEVDPDTASGYLVCPVSVGTIDGL